MAKPNGGCGLGAGKLNEADFELDGDLPHSGTLLACVPFMGKWQQVFGQ
jgi:hypothetical protein